MKDKITFLLPLLLVLFITGFAQNGKDVVYLKDGSVIRGTLIEYLKTDHLRIKTEEGTVHEYPASEVRKTFVRGNSGGKADKLPVEVKAKGYFNYTSLGLMGGNFQGYSNRVNPSLQMVNGYRFLTRYQAGLGMGAELWDNHGYFPLFADFRANLLKGDFSPFASVQGGYAIPFFKEGKMNIVDWGWYGEPTTFKGGAMASANIGFTNYTKQHFGYSISLGYRFQELNSVIESSFWNGEEVLPYTIYEKSRMNRIELRFGFLFN